MLQLVKPLQFYIPPVLPFYCIPKRGALSGGASPYVVHYREYPRGVYLENTSYTWDIPWYTTQEALHNQYRFKICLRYVSVWPKSPG